MQKSKFLQLPCAFVLAAVLVYMLLAAVALPAQAATKTTCTAYSTNMESAESLYVGQSKKLKVKTRVSPANDKIVVAVAFTSSAPDVASVSESGKIKALAKGEAKITAKVTFTKGKKTLATKRVRVVITVKQQVTSIELSNAKTLYIGKLNTSSTKLSASVAPENADNQKIKWVSSDSSIATVTSKGKVEAVSFGTVKITARAADGQGAATSTTITVKPLTLDGIVEVAHRGVSALAPENTLVAFQLAVEQGFDAIECDVWEVQPDSSGTPGLAIMHDQTLERMCGDAYTDIDIRSLTIDELTQIPVTGGNNASSYEQQCIPTLRQYLELFKDNSIIPYIEVKSANRMESGAISQEAANEVVSQVIEYGLQDRAVIQSFSLQSLKRIKTAMETYGVEIKMVAILDNPYHVFYKDTLVPELVKLGIYGATCTETLGTAEFAQECKSAGIKFSVYGVSDLATLGYYINEVGVYSLSEDQRIAWGS